MSGAVRDGLAVGTTLAIAVIIATLLLYMEWLRRRHDG